VSNHTGTTGISHGDEPNTYLGAGGAKRGVDATDGIESHTDASTGQEDAHSIETNALTATNAPETVSTRPTEPKTPDPPTKAAHSCANEPNGCSNRTDRLTAQADAPNALNGAETAVMGHRDSADTYLGTGDAKRAVDETDGIGSHADASNGQTNAPSVHTDAITPTIAPKIVRTHPIEPKSPNLPAGSATSRSDATDGFGSHTDTSSVCTDVHCAGNDTQMATNEAESIRTRQNSSKMLNSPHGREVATPEYIYEWKRVSVGDGDV